MTRQESQKIRYAVIGIGSIAQEAVLPAFEHAENSSLAAIVSGDEVKREELGRRYHCRTYSYERIDECLSAGEVDAIYITLPNHLHRQYAERAAHRGIHILCEKPLAPSEEDCRAIIKAAQNGGVKLMTAYRLHFEEANLEAVRICEAGDLGDVRIFQSVFCQQVEAGNVRLAQDSRHGGGPLYDMGVYCINAARYLFRAEPVEATAFRSEEGGKRFANSEEMMSVILRFPEDRLCAFTVSFGAASISRYVVVGTKGVMTADPAYDYSKALRLVISKNGEQEERTFLRRDQFAPELIYFSNCILNNRQPEPSGEEGLIDVQIVRAIYKALESGRAVAIETEHRRRRPGPIQEIDRPPVEEPELLHAKLPSGAKRKP